MKQELLTFLVCPNCQIALNCEVASEQNGEIIDGTLACPQCATQYPVVRGIPRFVTQTNPLSGKNIDTANAFGWEWQEFAELHDLATYEAQFNDWISPIQPDFLAGKTVLDAGCGMGRFSLVSNQYGAKNVLAIDASDAVEAAYHNARDTDSVHVIQADLHQLPLRQGSEAQMEFIFSIGVLHHLDIPQAGFQALVHHLNTKGSIFAWVYGRENNGWVVKVINPIRTVLTSRLPRRVLYALSWLITIFLHPLVRYVYRPVYQSSKLTFLQRILPYGSYFSWLGQFGFRHNHHVVFDHLVAPVAYYLRREEFANWFYEANLEIIDMSWRNENSWRGHGRFPQTNKQDL